MEDDLNNSYSVKTGTFEGPFSLLLDLVKQRKLFISDISLSKVTEDYIKYVNNLGSMHPSIVSNFIIVAATLILIKSKSLLPGLNLTLSEENDISDLEDRLRLYEIFSSLSVKIKEKFGKNIIFIPQEHKNQTIIFLPDEQISKESMLDFARVALGRIPKKISLPEVEVKKVISIEEMIDNLTQRIQESMPINFRDISGKIQTKEDKVVMIVGFLAMLELVRQGILHVIQDNNFDDIMMEKQEIINKEELIEQEENLPDNN